MNELNCDGCRMRLHAYLDNELGTDEALRMHAHLQSCANCRAELAALEALKTGLRLNLPRFELSELSERRILSRLKAEAPKRWLVPTVSAAALAASITLFFTIPSQRDSGIEEAVSSHVRSLQEQHLTDVPSSDKHTVKPWFSGRLDFSPPVTDFTAQGYPLIGGRMDYIRHQNAAGLVYRHNKHIINLFITTTDKMEAGMRETSLRGYNVIDWRRNHMEFTVVSDLNAPELREFTRLVFEQSSPPD